MLIRKKKKYNLLFSKGYFDVETGVDRGCDVGYSVYIMMKKDTNSMINYTHIQWGLKEQLGGHTDSGMLDSFSSTSYTKTGLKDVRNCGFRLSQSGKNLVSNDNMVVRQLVCEFSSADQSKNHTYATYRFAGVVASRTKGEQQIEGIIFFQDGVMHMCNWKVLAKREWGGYTRRQMKLCELRTRIDKQIRDWVRAGAPSIIRRGHSSWGDFEKADGTVQNFLERRPEEIMEAV